jgi:outer membrane protein assembly factor BamB
MTSSTASVIRTLRPICLAALALGAGTGTAAYAQDWPQWRGPTRDGNLAASAAPTRWPATLTRGWRVPVGEGHASPLVVGKAVYVFAREGEDEVARRLDLATGREAWRDRYPAPYEMNPAARGHGKGPKSTPAFGDGRLYTFGITGVLSCLDANTGKVVWRHEFSKKHKQTSPLFGTAMSPLLDRGLLIAHVGGQDDGALTAFDARTGAVRWRRTEDGPAYASPIAVTLGGVRQIVTQTEKNCVGIDAATGNLLWSLPFTTAYDQNSITPVAVGDRIVFAGMRQPTFAVRPVRKGSAWEAEKLWQTGDVTMYMSTPVYSGGRLYGFSERRSGQMFVLDAATGKTLWTGEGRQGDNASIWDAGPHLLALTTGADLIVYRKEANALTEAARYTVADSAVWASPALSGGRLLVKDVGTLTLWLLSAPAKAAAR